MSKSLPNHDIALAFPAARTGGSVISNLACTGCKSVVDFLGALVAFLMLWPLLLGIAIAIRMSDGGPAIFSQTRIGKNGRPFKCFKFRSMVLNAEQALKDHLASSPQAQAEWAEHQKLSSDPRITSFGRFLRKTSLDELPQVFNILMGQMSFVGPRPIVPDEIPRYGESFAHCFSVPPGLTGLWQISGRSDCGYQNRVALDCRYASDWNLWLDAEIVVKTIPAVLMQRGSR
ncbi:sugar transferase [Phreatobacter aquaticus]|uniref:Sugar transferase n=1 Tax=Phreatobacter aquaticus TaxID=2570229 RepID=A0A4D7QPG7_9HYPH|nr:sugar transferase [Phreatobacter aquaticus]QCK87823.1 sugar transferase [Phreatobacter aquaticus]